MTQIVWSATSRRSRRLPATSMRLERGLSSLSGKDFETRKAWAAWAERRARDFKDEALLEACPDPGGRSVANRGRHQAAGRRCAARVAGDGPERPPPPHRRARSLRLWATVLWAKLAAAATRR